MSEEKFTSEADKQVTVSFTIEENIRRDAWNWWDAVNKSSHGEKWIDRLPEQEREVLTEQCAGRTEEVALDFLVPYLEENYYVPNKESYEESLEKMRDLFEQKLQPGCAKLVEVMGKPLYIDDFTITLTTFNRGPYNKEKGWFMIGYIWSDPLRAALHEISHFQFTHYWRENSESEVSKMSFEAFDYLKEALTIILDEDFVQDGIISAPDRGYLRHQELRKKLTEKWQETHNFDELVNFGVQELSNSNYLIK